MRRTLLLVALLLVTASCERDATGPPEPRTEDAAAVPSIDLACADPTEDDVRMAKLYASEGGMWDVVSIQRLDVPAPVEYGRGELAGHVHMVSYLREGGVEAVAIEATRQTGVLLCAQDLDGAVLPGAEDIPFTCTAWALALEGTVGQALQQAADVAERCALEAIP